MANKAYLRIHQDLHLDYLVLDEGGNSLLSGSAFHDDQLPEFPEQLDVSLIVPGTDVLLIEMSMPKTSRSQLEKALPYALEEQLIEDLDHLHFVASKQDNDGNVHVLIVKKALLSAWTTRCREVGLFPTSAIPDYLAILPLEKAWHVYLEGDKAMLRQQCLQGLSIEQTQLPQIIALNLAEQEQLDKQAIVIDYDDGNEHFESDSLSDLNVDVIMADEHYFCMEMFAKGYRGSAEMNLLTDEYISHKPKERKTLLWKVALIVLAAWVFIWLLGNITQYFVYHSRIKSVTGQITTLYKKAFPSAQAVVSPRVRIERALKGVQTTGGGVFLNLLTQLGQQIKQQKNTVAIDNINFRDNTLSLSVTAGNFQVLANLSKALQAKGLSVQQQNSSSQGKTVSARLIIKGASNG